MWLQDYNSVHIHTHKACSVASLSTNPHNILQNWTPGREIWPRNMKVHLKNDKWYQGSKIQTICKGTIEGRANRRNANTQHLKNSMQLEETREGKYINIKGKEKRLWLKEWRHLRGKWCSSWKKIFTLQKFLSHFTTGKYRGQMLKVDPNMERSMTCGLILVSWRWILKRLRAFLSSPSLSDSNASWLPKQRLLLTLSNFIRVWCLPPRRRGSFF